MNRLDFLNRFSFLLTTAAAVVVLSLAGPVQACHKGEPHGRQASCDGDGGGADDGGGGGGSGKVAVGATFRDGIDDRILSDGLNREYQGEIDKARFQIPLGEQARNLTLDFSDCASFDADCQPPFERSQPDEAKVFFVARKERSQNLLEDETAVVGLKLVFTQGGSDWFLNFNPDPEVEACETVFDESSSITMTRVDNDTWGIEAFEFDQACLQEQVPVGKGNKKEIQFRGNYFMPFEVTAVRK